ncbi:MAG: hypothetical protein QM500_04520 [Methylococcales bacterium]
MMSDNGNLGKHWAAVKGDRAIAVISMSVPGNIDFESFRDKAAETLSILGDVKSGEVVRRNDCYYFIQRLTHSNRSKKPRTPKEFKMFCEKTVS